MMNKIDMWVNGCKVEIEDEVEDEDKSKGKLEYIVLGTVALATLVMMGLGFIFMVSALVAGISWLWGLI